jgi:hypothetical protein
MKRVLLASVAVNKAADYYTNADEVVPPRPSEAPTIAIESDGGLGLLGRMSQPAKDKRTRPKTTLDRLHQLEVELDTDLARSYERFQHGEITANEMEREQDRLIGSFNQRVRSENIRYRSMMRRRSSGVR